MLNSTKTWQEEFDERFPYIIKNLLDEELRKYPNLTNEFWEAIKQFISDLIAQTREETISEVENMINKEFPHQKLYCEAQDLRCEILGELNKLKK